MGSYKPEASKLNTVVFGHARFQFMTDRIVRMEYCRKAIFEDRATLTVVNRAFPAVELRKEINGNTLVIATSALTLSYTDDGQVFSEDNLKIEFNCNGKEKKWYPGMEDKENLGGTLRTLDAMDGNIKRKKILNPNYIPNRKGKGEVGTPGQSLTEFVHIGTPVELGKGLISKSGWTVVDDTQSVVMDKSKGFEWVAERRKGAEADLYFIGYGKDYKAALRDCADLLGRQPMPPRYALGCWFSRYWAYTDQEIEELVDGFDRADVPLDVIVIDMDWHLEGWTGYTWDRRYFPDPDEFLSEMHRRGLKVTLNLHPASGVGKHEEQFKDMARAVGLNPEQSDTVKFDITDPKYIKAYFELLHHPEERRGVDFWWMDWQQGESSNMKGLDPLPWINHLHWHDMAENARRNKKRPLIFSRWGGLGAGRYCIGFSGDTHSNWGSLAFQPYFTATASNVLYGYWSHDIGGHMPGVIEPELFARWLQFGAYSPILRTHTTKNVDAERRVWEYPDPYSHIMMETIRKRYELVPYIYTECRKTYETGISLCHPVYYDWPDAEAAYKARNQYMFGESMLVAPVIERKSEKDDMAAAHVWLPDGDWYDTARGLTIKGGKLITARYTLDEVPVFVRPGTVVPGEKGGRRLNNASVENLLITVYSGTEGNYTLYEDDGESTGYEKSKSAYIRISHLRKGKIWKVKIDKPEGSYKGFKSRKNIELRIEGTVSPEAIRVKGRKVPFSFRPTDGDYWNYDGMTGTIVVSLNQQELKDGLEISITLIDGNLKSVEGWKGFMNRMSKVKFYSNLALTMHVIHGEERLGVDIAQAGNRISRHPDLLRAELKRTKRRLKELFEILKYLKRHHIGTGNLKSPGKRSPDKIPYCNKALAILKECNAFWD